VVRHHASSRRGMELRWATAMICAAENRRWSTGGAAEPAASARRPCRLGKSPRPGGPRACAYPPVRRGRRADAGNRLWQENNSNTGFARVIVHALLAHLPDLPMGKRAARGAPLFFQMRGVDAENSEALLAETFAILDHPQFPAAFAPGSRAESGNRCDLPDLGAGASRERTNRLPRGDR